MNFPEYRPGDPEILRVFAEVVIRREMKMSNGVIVEDPRAPGGLALVDEVVRLWLT